MKYALLVYASQQSTGGLGRPSLPSLNTVFSETLQSAETATTVRLENGQLRTFDAPAFEVAEQLTAFHIIECDNLDDALEAVRKMPNLAVGSVEIRPIIDSD